MLIIRLDNGSSEATTRSGSSWFADYFDGALPETGSVGWTSEHVEDEQGVENARSLTITDGYDAKMWSYTVAMLSGSNVVEHRFRTYEHRYTVTLAADGASFSIDGECQAMIDS